MRITCFGVKEVALAAGLFFTCSCRILDVVMNFFILALNSSCNVGTSFSSSSPANTTSNFSPPKSFTSAFSRPSAMSLVKIGISLLRLREASASTDLLTPDELNDRTRSSWVMSVLKSSSSCRRNERSESFSSLSLYNQNIYNALNEINNKPIRSVKRTDGI